VRESGFSVTLRLGARGALASRNLERSVKYSNCAYAFLKAQAPLLTSQMNAFLCNLDEINTILVKKIVLLPT
jgi:hypothetical protein